MSTAKSGKEPKLIMKKKTTKPTKLLVIDAFVP